MMRSSVGVLDEYGKAFRDLINVKMGSRDKSVRELLRLNKDDVGVISESVVTNCRMCILLAKQHVGAFVRK